ncbi:LON peptidase substrate-binding domain-containing protein, partial [Ilumatobacter sp.]|uniref:LON peptidase substrate-binding domain-containing protein n=1 Tax=Ilumatobacter sp. TaxID=1967498 RepID=UPI003AF5C18D
MASIPTTSPTISLPVITLPAVVLPGATLTLDLGDGTVRAAVEAARERADGRLAIATTGEHDAESVLVVANVPNVGTLPNGTPAAIVHVDGRARAIERTDVDDVHHVELELLDDPPPTSTVQAATRELRATLELIAELRRSRRLPDILHRVTAPGALADAVALWADLANDDLARVLHAVDPADRVDAILAWAKRHLAELQVAETIRNDVSEGMDQHQREFLLRQQLAAIRRELGDDEDDTADEFRARLADLRAPEAVRDAIGKELDRFERMSTQSPEHSWVRTWLDRIFEMPWGEVTADQLDLDAAKRQLDVDHYGLDDVKDRIVEFLATRKLRHDRGLDRVGDPDDRRGSRGGKDHRDGARDGSASDRAWRPSRPDSPRDGS